MWHKNGRGKRGYREEEQGWKKYIRGHILEVFFQVVSFCFGSGDHKASSKVWMDPARMEPSEGRQGEV